MGEHFQVVQLGGDFVLVPQPQVFKALVEKLAFKNLAIVVALDEVVHFQKEGSRLVHLPLHEIQGFLSNEFAVDQVLNRFMKATDFLPDLQQPFSWVVYLAKALQAEKLSSVFDPSTGHLGYQNLTPLLTALSVILTYFISQFLGLL